jgi:hypothetical protein
MTFRDRLACDGLMLIRTGGAMDTRKHSDLVGETNEGRGVGEFLLLKRSVDEHVANVWKRAREMDDQKTRRLMMA